MWTLYSSQIPPMYSAKKVGGTRLYTLARQGKTVGREMDRPPPLALPHLRGSRLAAVLLLGRRGRGVLGQGAGDRRNGDRQNGDYPPETFALEIPEVHGTDAQQLKSDLRSRRQFLRMRESRCGL